MKRITVALIAAVAIATAPTYADFTTYFGRGQLRRTVDSDCSCNVAPTSGTVLFRKDSKTQMVLISIKGLAEDNFGIFVGESSAPNTGDVVYAVAPLDRTNAKKGMWFRKLTSGNPALAPVELPVDDLDQLAGGILVIAKAGENELLTGVTNIVNGVTNVTFGIPVPLPDTTNLVYGTLWAPIPQLLVNKAKYGFTRRATLNLPEAVGAPSPDARGSIRTRFNGVTGQSVIDLRAKKLARGQTYTVYIADSTDTEEYLLIPAGTLTPSKSGNSFRYTRDTRFADPLPQQARDIVDLSGRIIQIRDNFGFIHLEGIVP